MHVSGFTAEQKKTVENQGSAIVGHKPPGCHGPWAAGVLRVVGRGPWAVGRGPWAVGRGPWAAGLLLAKAYPKNLFPE